MIDTANTHANSDPAADTAVSAASARPPRIGLRNTENTFGVLAIILHWLIALVVIGLFVLGTWMTGLTYYDDWYKQAPDLHKSIGILLFFVMLTSVIWRASNITPQDEPGIGALQRRLAHGVQLLMYVLLFAITISGYLISTADGRPIDVFGLFSVPASISGIPNQEDIAGKVHWYLSLILISLAGLHAAAALKHHFIDHDRTLKKMLGIQSKKSNHSRH